MKNSIFFFILTLGSFFLINVNLFAQCPPGNVILLSQADVDAFVADYPNCTEIAGNLEIGDSKPPYSVSDITDISGLSKIKKIWSSLRIYYNPFLTSLDGLLNVNSLWQNLEIVNNSSLINLSGLQGITYAREIKIENNGFLISLEGLNNIDSAGTIVIGSNSSLTNLEGLNMLKKINGYSYGLDLYNNANLLNISGLENLNIIEGNLNINQNNNLESLVGLSSLRRINGKFSLYKNNKLKNFEGLNNLESITNHVSISNALKLNSLNGLENLKSVGGLSIVTVSQLTDLSGLKNLEEINGGFGINSCNSLLNLNGLSSLKRIVGSFGLISNHSLQNLFGLDKLTFLWGNLEINNNQNLQSIEGIENVFLIGGGSVNITNNTILSECDVLSICSFLNSTGYAEIHDNATGCNSVEEVEEACGLDCAGLKVQASSVRTTCGHDNGTATATGSGGTPPYSFAWSNGDTLQSPENLAPGYYTVTITDSIGCQNHHFTSVGTSLGFTLTINTTDETFSGANDGTATSFTEGGEEPFSYLWSTGANSQAIQNLTPGSYSVTVIDSSACEESAEAIINSFGCACIGIHSLAVYPTCFESCDGSLEVLEVHNGQAPYSYLWSTGDTLAKIAYLCAGDYQLTLTDAYHCETTISYTIEQPDEILIEIGAIVHVHGDSLGSIQITISGGTGNYRLKWTGENGFVAITEDLSDLIVGCYVLEVIDEKYCTVSSESICIEDLTNVQNDLEEYGIMVYPNPADEYLTLDFTKTEPSECLITITNISGQSVSQYKKDKTDTILSLDTEQLEAGVYLLKLDLNDKYLYRKIVVVH